MKLCLALLALVGFVAAASFPATTNTKEVKYADKDFLVKQKFLYEIVYRVEDPLMFEEWIKLGQEFVFDKAHYTHFDFYMEKFYESYKLNALLPKGEFFGALAKTHHKQAFGLFNFFYYAKDWETFVHNVCWARLHVNEGMFVYALNLAVIHRDDFKGLALPMIYEIFPQYFFNSKFVYDAEKFDYDVFSKLIMYEKEYKDILYKDVKDYQGNFYYFTRDWKTFQWWKMMGLDETFYTEEKYILRENYHQFNQDPKFLDILHNTKMFFYPVDYTRDIDFFNDHTKISYFTEDLGWNAYWYYLNMDYAFFLEGKQFGLNKDRRGEHWVYTLQQMLARYYFERLSNGFGDIPEFSFFGHIEHGYDPQLISYNGVGYSYRKNYYEFQSYGNFDMMNQVYSFFKRIYDILDNGIYKTVDGQTIDLRKPESIEFIGNLMQGNIDTYDKYFFQYWYLLSNMYFADVDYNDYEVFPNVFMNFETMLRDPMFYIFHKKIADVYFRFKSYLKPYTREELTFPGVTIKDFKIDELVTYFDLVDFDVSNLLNDKMTFADGEFVWDKALFARQARLNHKPFNFEFVFESDKVQKAVVRVFMGPKFDEYGRTISLTENRENFMEIDEFVYDLKAGNNQFKRSSKDFYWTVSDRTTYTELYKYIMLAYEGKYDYPIDFTSPHCGFPDRLILPHGWAKGLPMQFAVFIYPYQAKTEQFVNYDHTYYCGIGSGARFIDEKPFGYPFDRTVDEYQYYVPNMFFKDVKIYHEDKFQKYYENKYEHFGTFDYTLF